MRRLGLVISLLVPTFLVAAPPKSLTLEDRIAARRAIEEVYWRHRTWPADNPGPKPSLDQVLPESAIRARVEDDLRKSEALASVCDDGGFDAWWAGEKAKHPVVLPVAIGTVEPVTPSATSCTDDTWSTLKSTVPDALSNHVAVWTGTVGFRYNPATDTWMRMSNAASPQGRENHTAVWTGTEMIVCGGSTPTSDYVNTGGRRDRGSLGTDSEGSTRPNANPCP